METEGYDPASMEFDAETLLLSNRLGDLSLDPFCFCVEISFLLPFLLLVQLGIGVGFPD